MKQVWNLCKTDEIISNSRYQWSIIAMENVLMVLFYFSPLLSFVALVGQSMSVEFLADMKMGRETRVAFRIMLG